MYTSLTYVHHVDYVAVWSDRGDYNVLVARLPNDHESMSATGRHIFPHPLSALLNVTSD